MGRKAERTDGARAELALKHPILGRLEKLIEDDWHEFEHLREQYGRMSPLEIVNESKRIGLITAGQCEMIENNWSDQLAQTVRRFGDALQMVEHGPHPKLNSWVVLGASSEIPRILIDNDGRTVDVVLLTPKLKTDDGTIMKGRRRWDPEFFKVTSELHGRLDRIFRQIKKRKKKDRKSGK